MKNLGKINTKDSIPTAGSVERAFEVEIIGEELYVRTSADLSRYTPVVFRRVRRNVKLNSGKKYRKKGWVSPHFSRASINQNGKVSWYNGYYGRDGESLSSSPNDWITIDRGKMRVKWSCNCVPLTNSDGDVRPVTLTFGIGFCTPTTKENNKVSELATQIVDVRVRVYHDQNTGVFRAAFAK